MEQRINERLSENQNVKRNVMVDQRSKTKSRQKNVNFNKDKTQLDYIQDKLLVSKNEEQLMN